MIFLRQLKGQKAILATLGVWLMVTSYSTLHALPQAPGSVLEGVFTEKQATRGQSVFAEECAFCHGTAAEGTADLGPPLSGPLFIEGWTSQTVADLFEKTRTTMPSGDPEKLSRAQYADVIAYLLHVNKFPAGQTELASETEALSPIRLVAPNQ